MGNKSRATITEIFEIGRFAAQKNAVFLIRAPSDADSRWIFQHLQEGANPKRLRGNIEIAQSSEIVLRFVSP